MKKILLTIMLIYCVKILYAVTINIPSDYSTIQAGINASNNGDTVLVQPGTYVENINYNGKNITVGSLFYTTLDPSYISQTIIDGDSLDCVVRFQNGEDSTAVLIGFTIRNGNSHSGAGIFCWNNSSPSLERLVISGNNATSKGGGVLCYWTSSPNLKYVEIKDNYSSEEGGGLCCGNDSSPRLDNVTISGNVTSGLGGGICCKNNSSPSLENITISGNSSDDGGGMYCDNSSPSLDDVIISGNNASDDGGGIFCDNSSPNLDSVTISGNNASDLGGGLHCRDHSSPSLVNVTISDNSSLDKGGGVYCFSYSSPSLVNVTISGNSSDDYGGGMYLYRGASPDFVNVIISNNSSSSRGGGIYCDDSTPSLKDVFISGNNAYDYGGGMYCNDSSPSLENVTVSGNSAIGSLDAHGGGIYFRSNSSPIFDITNRCNIHSNTTGNMRGAGVDIYSSNNGIIDIIVDTFSVMTPTDYYASPVDQFTFDILHSIEDSLVNGDVYVSVDGDDSNTGTSPDEPFKTIRRALSKIYSDSLNINTIHLAQGIYSDSTNGEEFPLNWSSYVNLSGSDQDNTILDARNNSGVMELNDVNNTIIENITITNGNAEYGAGIYCIKSSPNLKNLIIKNNYASYGGGGIFCEYNSSPCLEDVILISNSAGVFGAGIYCSDLSSPSLVYVTISGNSAGWYGGGLYCCYDSSPSLDNVTISDNSAEDGGGIFCRSSSPSLLNVTMSGNVADTEGGGMYFYSSSPILKNVTIVNNYAPGGGYAQGAGGGIYCYHSSPSLENVTISDNSAGVFGGGIYCNYNSSTNFSATNRCNIHSNTTGNMRGAGVDIYSSNNGIIDIIVDTFSVMTPTDYYASPVDQFTFDILHSIEDSLVNGDVYVSVDGDDSNTGTSPDEPFKTIRHALSKIYSDSLNINTIHLAQGIYSDSTNGEEYPLNWSSYVNLSGSDQDNTILDARNNSGVMELNDVNNTIIENITITNGNAEYGGGIYCSNSSPHFANIIISNNSAIGSYAQGEGGGIYCYYSSPSLENVTISDNCAVRYGGGIYCNNSSPSLENVTISNNSATGGYEQGEGGGIFCNSSFPILVNVIISGNSADIFGGGIFCNDSSPSLANVTILNNSLTGSYAQGGGIFCRSSSPCLENVYISSNSAPGYGGGVYCTSNSSPCLEKVTISDNYSNHGGGIYCYYSSPSLQKVTVTGNNSNRGGGFYCNYSSPSLENLTISSNSASNRGSGIYCYESSPSIINTIVSYNTGNYGIYASSSNPSITYSDFYENEYGNFYGCGQDMGVNVTTNANGDSCDVFYNIQLDPLFVNFAAGDFHLTQNSPCIDAGDPNSPLDPDGTIADIGAFYYDQLSVNNIVDSNEHLLFNYPNPIHSTVNNLTVSFSIHKSGNVKIQLFNIKGQLVSTLINEDKNIGEYTITHTVNKLSTGIYFTKMSVDGVDKEIRKVVLLR